MAKYNSSKFDLISLLAPILIITYLLLGFIPNWQAVDRIAPQWLIMAGINLIGLIFFVLNRSSIGKTLSLTINSSLTLTYILFIIWAIGSIIYAINPTEVVVNLSRQINVLLMFVIMSVCIHSIKNKIRFLPWVITIILGIEIYAVIADAIEIIDLSGKIDGGRLKGVTANRNITAFSLALKIPFTLFLIHIEKKTWIKLASSLTITLAAICLTMIQSRAALIAFSGITISYLLLQIVLYLRVSKKVKQLLNFGFIIIPLMLAILFNQFFLSDRGADVISRASTISISSNDDSINQRLRYYEDVLTHVISNPFKGVGLGNWKLKSIYYDSKDIDGYVVPYHAHSDFIQLGAELGLIGFFLYLGIFIWAVYYVYKLIRLPNIDVVDKIFLFFILISLGVYFIDANLNFPIARPQVLIIWTLIISIITYYYQKHKINSKSFKPSKIINYSFLASAILLILPSIYFNNQVYKSLKGQMFLLQDFNSNQFNLPINQVDNVVPDIPNITVTTIPINSVKARYYVNAKKYDRALALLEKGTKANPYLYYSEILKSQIFQEKGLIDSAKVYARKAFFGLPNNDLHASRYINLINMTRDREALEEATELLIAKNNINNWKNYLIVASGLYPPKSEILIKRAKEATQLFPKNQEIEALFKQIAIGKVGIENAFSASSKGLEYFNAQNYAMAAIEFEKAIEFNPLDYAYYENAATSNYLIGNLEKAEQQIDMVINDLNPLNGKCEYIKALIYIKMGDPIGACPLLATARDSGFSQAEPPFNQYCR